MNGPVTTRSWVTLTLVLTLIGFSFHSKSRALVFEKQLQRSSFRIPEKIELVYSADPKDPWNVVFHLLFTREVQSNLSNDFQKGGPFIHAEQMMGQPNLRVSTQQAERLEIGDRAIDPFYPSFFTDTGIKLILQEPYFSELKQALSSVLTEQTPRTITARALLQMDLWAAYDRLFRYGSSANSNNEQTLLTLLAQGIRKLALNDEDLSHLGTNYSISIPEKLPDVFNSESGWIEIQLLPNRLHDLSVDFRRAARVFIKPFQSPPDKAAFVESLKNNQHTDRVKATALLIQPLLIDREGRIRESPLINEVQLRILPQTTGEQPQVRQFELSRQKLLTDPHSTGFVLEDENSTSYIAVAGNDYEFASTLNFARLNQPNRPVLVQLHTRCSECHGQSQKIFMTFATQEVFDEPRVRILDPKSNDRVDHVSSEKQKRSDFKSLIERW